MGKVLLARIRVHSQSRAVLSRKKRKEKGEGIKKKKVKIRGAEGEEVITYGDT